MVLLGTYAFAWQIYGDFSGYSDIARGSAQLLGFHFMVNFRQPYLATSLQDFWRRWHISLSTWLRDYLYIPLGGNRDGERADLPQPDADDAARRPVARRELDVRRSGAGSTAWGLLVERWFAGPLRRDRRRVSRYRTGDDRRVVVYNGLRRLDLFPGAIFARSRNAAARVECLGVGRARRYRQQQFSSGFTPRCCSSSI